MRRKLPTFVLAVLAALATALLTASVAAATNGGLTPVDPASPNARHTVTAYWVIVGFTGFIFFLVEGLLVAFIWKYRSRGRAREVEGPQIHGQTRLEIIWTVIPVIILCVIAIVVFIELPKIDSPTAVPSASPSSIEVTVEGHQYYWQFDYPGGARSINTLYVPVGTRVDLEVVASDVIHSWWIPALGGKIQAIPGHPNHMSFVAERAGTYEGQCAELCGVYHASMIARVVAETQSEYVSDTGPTAAETLGRQEWTGVCATCHGNLGQGGFGPSISSNPTLIQADALESVIRLGVSGTTGAMPPVGDTWTGPQFKALETYLQQNIYRAAPVGS
ncbi:MAG: cytochrome c oxidase subunit [Gaiellaceae bacterium]|nr:cytochrome c oxidase subunit [Gaiellaceae bacterium]